MRIPSRMGVLIGIFFLPILVQAQHAAPVRTPFTGLKSCYEWATTYGEASQKVVYVLPTGPKSTIDMPFGGQIEIHFESVAFGFTWPLPENNAYIPPGDLAAMVANHRILSFILTEEGPSKVQRLYQTLIERDHEDGETYCQLMSFAYEIPLDAVLE